MSELIKQDTDFTKEILTSGGENLMKCYQCGTCSVVPRGAKPGEVLGAFRKLAIAEHSFPRFLGKAAGDPKYLLFLFTVPVVILLAILVYLGSLSISSIPKGEYGQIVYSKFMPVHLQNSKIKPSRR